MTSFSLSSASDEVDVVIRDSAAAALLRLRVLAVFIVPGSRLTISGFPDLPRDPAVAMISAVALNVLVVDDDPGFRSLAVRLLDRAGLHATGEADTVKRARELVHAGQACFCLARRVVARRQRRGPGG